MSGRHARKRQAKKARDDHKKVDYLVARDRFLEAEEKTDRVEWLVQVGRYVQDRWLAEEARRKEGEQLDEQAVWGVWDDLTEKQLRDLRTEAGTALKRHVALRTHMAVQTWFLNNFKPVQGILTALNWTFWQFLRGIVSGVAIIILGFVLAYCSPEVVKRARGTADAMLPADTKPATSD